ncbi:MAG: DNA helicase RecQ [Oscillospiraceae bacterium]|jgi:ATP-dependent DNA helicase RecQ|nr:DNA helicase RecQ [Oscillospiraceae bacterium]
MQKAREALKRFFGYDAFRPGQSEIIEQILSGRDALGIMPTGAGKSICYQIPAILSKGLTVVISPLISLMKDQVDALNQSGINCAAINSSLSLEELDAAMRGAARGVYQIIYVAPERLQNESFINFLKNAELSIIAVDEAHCVSHWGHDFRPSYNYIGALVEALPKRPVIAAFTATATEFVKNDVIKLLKLQEPFEYIGGFNRENLFFGLAKPSDRIGYLLDYLCERKDQSGIIYCITRREVDRLTQKIRDSGISAVPYHAGLSDGEREKNQEDFIYDRVPFIVATNAFGMGIDKSNVRFVLHCGMPQSIENYYQEAGRAGRDGERAECMLLFSMGDIISNRFIIEKGENPGQIQKNLDKLQKMVNYCSAGTCLRKYILNYFGEKAQDNCGMCSNCDAEAEVMDVSVEAQKIMSCIKRMGEGRFGAGAVSEVLRGGNTEMIRRYNFEKLSTYGIMKGFSDREIKEIVAFLAASGHIAQSPGKYSLLSLNASAYPVLRGQKKVAMQRFVQKEKPGPEAARLLRGVNEDYDRKLFKLLREKRREIASAQGLPPYIIFSDVSLRDMCIAFPRDRDSFLGVHGVGQKKYSLYGEDFIAIIQDYAAKNDIKPRSSSARRRDAVPERLPGAKTDTRQQSYDLYAAGMTVENIAKYRKLTVATVENHLMECKLKGLEVREFIQEDYKDRIFELIKSGVTLASKIKEALPGEVKYVTINYYLYLLKLKQ